MYNSKYRLEPLNYVQKIMQLVWHRLVPNNKSQWSLAVADIAGPLKGNVLINRPGKLQNQAIRNFMAGKTVWARLFGNPD